MPLPLGLLPPTPLHVVGNIDLLIRSAAQFQRGGEERAGRRGDQEILHGPGVSMVAEHRGRLGLDVPVLDGGQTPGRVLPPPSKSRG